VTKPCTHRTITYAQNGTATCARCKRATNIDTYADKPYTVMVPRNPIVRKGTKRAIALMFAFNLIVEDALIARGAVRSTYDRKSLHTSYAWVIDTPLGPLGVTPNGNYVVCMFARDYAAMLAPGNRGNPYSNKWNSHYDLGDLEGAHHFVYLLERLLAIKLGPEPDALDTTLARVAAEHPTHYATGTLSR
jgi:hypothetical protein